MVGAERSRNLVSGLFHLAAQLKHAPATNKSHDQCACDRRDQVGNPGGELDSPRQEVDFHLLLVLHNEDDQHNEEQR